MKEIIQQYIGEILTFLAGLGAWGYERKKRKQELRSARLSNQANETSNQQQVVELYQEALDDLKLRYDEKFADLEAEIKRLEKNLDLWKNKYRSLKAEFDNYRKNHP